MISTGPFGLRPGNSGESRRLFRRHIPNCREWVVGVVRKPPLWKLLQSGKARLIHVSDTPSPDQMGQRHRPPGYFEGRFRQDRTGGDRGLRIHPGARAGIRGQRHPPGQRHGRLPGPGDAVRLSFPSGPGPLGGRGPERWPLSGKRRPGDPQSGHRRASLGGREIQPVVCRLCPGGTQ